MLPSEIKPFADSCRDELEKIRQVLIKIRAGHVVTDDEYTHAMDMIQPLSRAFTRFEACLKDEQDTKNRYEAAHMERRLEKMRAERQ